MGEATTHKPLIAITMGDPAGIGPELCLKALAAPAVRAVCRPVIIGDWTVLEQTHRRLGLAPPTRIIPPGVACDPRSYETAQGGVLVDCGCFTGEVIPGQPTRAAGEASYRYIVRAIECAQAGAFAGVATAPITKAAWHLAGITEPGHTEVFAKLTGTQDFAMMFYSPRLVVSFVTCHQSLRSVPETLTTAEIRRVTNLTGQALSRIKGVAPASLRLGVLALNPHAGEGGLFGDEDSNIVAPAVELARHDGWRVEGPLPADAAFTPRMRERFDAFVTLYHDQGSIPFKMISVADGVNITMGLPIIRTSVDHGTAYDIAWQGIPDPTSLISAITLAARLGQTEPTVLK